MSALLSDLHAEWLRLRREYINLRRGFAIEVDRLAEGFKRENPEGYERLRISFMAKREQLQLAEDAAFEAHAAYLAQRDEENIRHNQQMEKSNGCIAVGMLIVAVVAALGTCVQCWLILRSSADHSPPSASPAHPAGSVMPPPLPNTAPRTSVE